MVPEGVYIWAWDRPKVRSKKRLKTVHKFSLMLLGGGINLIHFGSVFSFYWLTYQKLNYQSTPFL